MSKVVKFREDVETPRLRILNVSYFFAEVLGKRIVNPSPRFTQLCRLLTDKPETLIEGPFGRNGTKSNWRYSAGVNFTFGGAQ